MCICEVDKLLPHLMGSVCNSSTGLCSGRRPRPLTHSLPHWEWQAAGVRAKDPCQEGGTLLPRQPSQGECPSSGPYQRAWAAWRGQLTSPSHGLEAGSPPAGPAGPVPAALSLFAGGLAPPGPSRGERAQASSFYKGIYPTARRN